MYTLVEGKAVKKKLKRGELLAFFANYPVSLIGIEVCGSAHHWARERKTTFLKRGFVTPYKGVLEPAVHLLNAPETHP